MGGSAGDGLPKIWGGAGHAYVPPILRISGILSNITNVHSVCTVLFIPASEGLITVELLLNFHENVATTIGLKTGIRNFGWRNRNFDLKKVIRKFGSKNFWIRFFGPPFQTQGKVSGYDLGHFALSSVHLSQVFQTIHVDYRESKETWIFRSLHNILKTNL